MTSPPPVSPDSRAPTWSRLLPSADRDRSPYRAWRSPLDPAQNQMLDRIEAYSATLERITHGSGDVGNLEGLHQPQDLDELPLARLTHPPFENAAQRGELVRQHPIGQRRGLI
jgi:hypothetical protein